MIFTIANVCTFGLMESVKKPELLRENIYNFKIEEKQQTKKTTWNIKLEVNVYMKEKQRITE